MAVKKILVADDSLTIQKVIRLALSNDGYEIQAVSDGSDALQQISLFRPQVVLIDVSLPGSSAFDVKRAINAHPDLIGTGFILMSSAFEKVDETQVEALEFHGRLTKPFDPAHLRQVLTDVLAKIPADGPTDPAAEGAPAVPPRPAGGPPPLPKTRFGSAPPPPVASVAAPSVAPPVSVEPTLTLGAEEHEWNEWNSSETPATSPAEHEPAEETDNFEPLQSRFPVLEEHLTPAVPPAPPAHSGTGSTEPREDSEPAHGAELERHDDIRELTESTIRMSGLDDFEWSVSEPTLKPLSNMSDIADTTFGYEPAVTAPPETDGARAAEFSSSAEFTPPPPPPSPAAESSAPSAVPRFAPLPPPTPPMTASHGARAVAYHGPSPEEIESLIQHQVQLQVQQQVALQVEAALARMTQKFLPEVAERVIKQEIHRMLSENP